MVNKERFKELAILIPNEWQSLRVNEKEAVLANVLSRKDDILSACPGTKPQFDRAFGVARSRRGEGMALLEMRNALWSAYHGKMDRCK